MKLATIPLTFMLAWALVLPALDLEAAPKNVLLILADDQGYCELGSFLKFAQPDSVQSSDIPALKEMLDSDGGRKAIEVCFDAVRKATPNLDRLAAKGTRFTNFYAAPTCGPSRAALMSARYPQRYGVYSNLELGDRAGVPATVEFPIKTFANAGYRTGVFGKWHLGHGKGQHANDKGFDTYFGYDRAHTDKYDSPHLFRNRTKAKAKGWLCDQLTDEALAFLDGCDVQEKPFLLFLSLCEPKPPCPAPPKKYMDAIDSGSFVVDSHFGSLYGMDFNIGRVLAKLEAMGVEQDTMILYASDNGLNKGVWAQSPDYRKKADDPKAYQRVPIPGNGPLRGCKWTAWDGGVRVPMFASVPSGNSGESGSLQHIIDIMPTALDFAGLATDESVDGRSFLDELGRFSNSEPNRTLFWAHMDAIPLGVAGLPETDSMVNEYYSIKRKQSDYFGSWYVRSDDWKLIGWNDEMPLLFDIKDDPGELRNIAASHPEVVSDLRRAFLKWMADNTPPTVTKRETWQRMLD